MKKNIGCCGINCEKCDAFIATKNNDDELRAKTAELWSELNGVAITSEMINCRGCRASGIKTYFCENLCAIRKCAYAKEFETCANCTDIGDCEKIDKIFENNPDALKNLSDKN